MYFKTLSIKTVGQPIILFGFSIYFCITVLTGAVYRFVHERHIPLLLMSAAVFFAIGMLHVCRIIHNRTESREVRLQSVYHQVKILCAFALLITPFAGSIIAIGKETVPVSQLSFTEPLTERHNTVPAAPLPPAEKFELDNGIIVMNNDNFSPWLAELYTNADKWAGTKITISGFVWKDGELFKPDEFALARMMMVCCAADMQPVGILAQWVETAALSEGEWVQLSGILSKKPYNDGFDPIIIVEKIEKISRPQREFIYP